jgi:hypothetical protein
MRRGTVAALVIAALLVALAEWQSRCSMHVAAPRAQTKSLMHALEAALRVSFEEHGRLPRGTSAEIIQTLVAQELLKLRPGDRDSRGDWLDGWGNPIAISIAEQGQSFAIRSFGPNGKDEEGRGDDSVCASRFDGAQKEWVEVARGAK